MVKNLTSERNQNNNTSSKPHADKPLLCIRLVDVVFKSEDKVHLRRGPLCPILALPGSTLGGSGRKTTTLVRNHEYIIHTNFHQHSSNGSEEEVENIKRLHQTYDGQHWMTKAYLSLQLRWAKTLSHFWESNSIVQWYWLSVCLVL